MKENPALLTKLDDALAYISHNKYEKAEKLLLAVAEEYPDSYELLILLSQLYFSKKEYPTSIQYGIRATEIKPLSYDAHYQLGCSLNMNSWFDQAVIALKRAIEIEPGFSKTFVELAKSYECLSQKDEALAVYIRAVFLLREEFSRKEKSLDDFDDRTALVIDGNQFIRFTAKGNHRNLLFEAQDPLTKKSIRIRVFEEDSVFEDLMDLPEQAIRKGVISYERLYDSLCDNLKSKLELSQDEFFSYQIYNLEVC